jgi:hypothetical protein
MFASLEAFAAGAKRVEPETVTCDPTTIKVRPGDRVTFHDSGNERHWVGNVETVFDDCNVSVRVDGTFPKPFVRPAAILGVECRCLGDLCVGDRMLVDGRFNGIAREIFDNNTVKIDVDGTFPHPFFRKYKHGTQLPCE